MPDIMKTFMQCAICPGICVTFCPIYMGTHIRASSPNNLARLGLKHLKGYEGYDPALWLCTGCRECEYNCPVSNSLWNAIRISRGRKVRIEYVKTKIVSLGGKGSSLLIISSNELKGSSLEFLKRFYDVHWLNSETIYKAYWSGGNIQLDLYGFSYIAVDDLDVIYALPSEWREKVIYPIQVLDMLGYRNVLRKKGYVLHIPCKVPVKDKKLLIEVSIKVLGKPISILNKCIGGGGGLPERHPEVARELAYSTVGENERDYLIVTFCSRAKSHLLSIKYQVKTPFDLVEGEMS